MTETTAQQGSAFDNGQPPGGSSPPAPAAPSLRARALGVIVLAIFLAGLRWSYPPPWFLDALLLCPLAGVAYALARPARRPPPPFRRALGGFVVPACVFGFPLGFQAISHAHYVHGRPVLGAVATFTLAALILIWFRLKAMSLRLQVPRQTGKPPTPAKMALLGAFLFLWPAGYVYAAFTALDQQLDQAIPQTAKTQVIHKWRGRRSGYTVRLAPWGALAYAQDAAVPPDVHSALKVGSPACLRLHPGFLGAPWYEVKACVPSS